MTGSLEPLAEPQAPIENNRLRPDYVAEVVDAVDRADDARLHALVEPLHPADLADLIELVDGNRRDALVAGLGDRLGADVIAELTDHVRDGVVEQLTPAELADVVTELETDDAVALIEDMESEQQREVLRAIPADDRQAIEQALAYPEDSAGRLMQRDLVAVPVYWTIGQTIDFLREHHDLTTEFWEIFVVDEQHKPAGTMRLSWVLRTPRDTAVADVMQREQTLIPVAMAAEDVAHKFQQYHLISAAVVDASGRLAGQITVDDVVHIVREEAQKDLLALAGAGDGDVNEPVALTVRSRLPWLLVNLLFAMASSFIISRFDQAISQMVALAALMPIVSALGGNAGTQTMTVAVRAIATGQLTATNTARVLMREMRVNLLNAVAIAVVMGGIAALWYQCWRLGGVMAAAMVCNFIVAGLAGVLVPSLFERLKIDPASASAVFVTALTDWFGFTAFLGIAVMIGLGSHC